MLCALSRLGSSVLDAIYITQKWIPLGSMEVWKPGWPGIGNEPKMAWDEA